jgi:multisubunit Na+/H+ antiporter MnhC subunit
MHRHLKSLHELHHKHHITHKVLALIIFTIVVVLAVYGMGKVKAEEAAYAPVPNGNQGICFKVGENFNDPTNHVSCKTHRAVCVAGQGILVECITGNVIR